MKLTCYLFGHKLPEFMRLTTEVELEGATHNTRTDTYVVFQPCARCKREFRVGYISVRDGRVVQ
jgi:hypothetical protein